MNMPHLGPYLAMGFGHDAAVGLHRADMMEMDRRLQADREAAQRLFQSTYDPPKLDLLSSHSRSLRDRFDY